LGAAVDSTIRFDHAGAAKTASDCKLSILLDLQLEETADNECKLL
jgi:hypothetical protein